jgi:hypothetical protein
MFIVDFSMGYPSIMGGGEHRGRVRMVVRFTTTYAISAYYDYRCELESCSGDVTMCIRNSIM